MSKPKSCVLALLLVIANVAHAQQQNPNNHHGAHHPDSPGYIGLRNQQQTAPQATGRWEKTWGAIAPSPEGGVVGTAVGAKSKHEAKRLAMADCMAKGGGGACKVDVTYHNQCAAMVLGENTYSWARAATVEEATEIAFKDCIVGNNNCRVYYSACTEPVFHQH